MQVNVSLLLFFLLLMFYFIFNLEFVEPGSQTVARCVSVPTLRVLDLTQENQEHL